MSRAHESRTGRILPGGDDGRLCYTPRMTTNQPFVPPQGFSCDDLCSRIQSRSRKRRAKYRKHRKRPPVFEKLPRSARRTQTVSIAWRIKCDINGAGIFSTHQILPGSKEWPIEDSPKGPMPPTGGSGWVDFLFLSRKPRRAAVFYNAYAKTVGMEIVDRIVVQAAEAVKELLSEEDQNRNRIKAFTRKLASGGSEMVFAPALVFDILDGLTSNGYMGQWLIDRLDSIGALVEVCPNAKLVRDYTYGIGLEMIVKAPSLTVESLANEVRDFLDRGEIEYNDGPIELAPYLAQAREDVEAIAWSFLRIDANSRGLPDPTPEYVSRSKSDLCSVPIRVHR